MSSNKKLNRYGRFLTYVLRHRPGDIGISLDDRGWTNVQELITKTNNSAQFPGMRLSLELVKDVVENDDKNRFEFSNDESMIRASQGHSIKVDLGLQDVTPPARLFHGTVKSNLESIMTKGLIPGDRHAVHLSSDHSTAKVVGSRRGEAIILVVDSESMDKDGYKFQCSSNGVWLTQSVPSKYITYPHE